MTQRDIARLAFRVLAVWALIDAVKPMQASLTRLAWLVDATRFSTISLSGVFPELASFAFPAIQVAIAVWLWRNAGVVAAWSLGHSLHDDQDEPEIEARAANAGEIQAVVLSSLGVWLLVSAVPMMASQILDFLIAFVVADQQRLAAGREMVDTKFWVWCIEFLLGLWLIFGAHRITGLLRRARGDSPG